MITCHIRYEIDPAEIEAFERFARRWIELVARHGGTHHGYFLPAEGASDIAYAVFSFPSLADYERYRERFGVDPEFIEADRIRDESVGRAQEIAARVLDDHVTAVEVRRIHDTA